MLPVESRSGRQARFVPREHAHLQSIWEMECGESDCIPFVHAW